MVMHTTTPAYGGMTAPSRRLNKDWLAMVHRDLAAKAAHEALFPVQGLQPEVMVLGIAVLFATIVARCGLDPQELHHMGVKVLRAAPSDNRTNDTLQSLQDFAGVRIMGESNVSIA